VLHLLAVEPPSVRRHNGDVACQQDVNLRRKLGVSIVFDWYSPGVKALVWFWIIDETLVLTSMLSVCRLNEVDTCQVMEQSDDHGDDGDDHKMIKCSTWKRRKRKTKPCGDQGKCIA